MSNYTASIEFDNLINDNVKLKFLTQQLNKRAFIASQLIKRDLRIFTANEIELIDEGRLKYFHHNLKEIKLNNVVNIDLKNAYATVLFNDGFICEKTYKYLLTLPKKDRLASVGFLAYKKEIFSFQDGGLQSHTKEEGEFKNIFFYCVRKVHLIMNELSEMFKANFLFSWVDGIYFYNITPELSNVFYYLDEKQYKYTCENLKNFKCINKENNFFISFDKGLERKIFNIPKSNYLWQNDLYEFINRKYKQ